MAAIRLTFVCVGRLSREYAALWRHYESLLKPYAALEVFEVSESPLSHGQGQAKPRDGKAIRELLRPGALTIALDVTGRQYSSEEWSAFLAAKKLHGISHFQFILGGAAGLDEQTLATAGARWSLSRLTLPHQMARCVALEQIYRAVRIERGEPYHH
ncbi:MAG: 23S rRNA (pseudouridine(1915)-N(3))-methyltransferase RlmH [Actinobacteria bacterium]|nr:23S rRNA (pseudouridine(1915)-N(3))-methyltransferase RlmH [Actinomycetota bacterium]